MDPKAYQTFKTALNSGEFSDFQKIIMGGTRTLNGPQAGLAFCLVALDNAQFGQPQVPPAPAAASHQNATELLEHYWASLLRDVAFTDYPSNYLAALAAAELGSQPTYLGPRNRSGQVTPDLLFRGAFPGETLGPYLSQFFLQPTFFGSQPIGQQQVTYLPNIDYGPTSPSGWMSRTALTPVCKTRLIDSSATGVMAEILRPLPTWTCSIRRTSPLSWCSRALTRH